jgi:hypothetical protein
MGAGGGDVGFCVTGDGRVAIEDEVAVRSDAAGVDLGTLGTALGTGEAGKEERDNEGSLENATADRTCNWGAKSGRTKNQIMVNGHGGLTSLLR